MNERSQSLLRRLPSVRQDLVQQCACLAPLVALEAEQDRRFIREILIEGAHAHARPLRHAGCGEPGGSFRPQNLNSRVEHGRNEVVGTRLFGLFS